LALGSVFAASAAWGAPAGALSEAQARYQKERAACLSGASHQDQATCLKEAGAALAEARRGQLDKGMEAEQRRQNALQRCKPLPAADRETCEARILGEGTVSGSVEGGGVYRELVIRSVGPVPEGTGVPSR
jgi:hypothetical protein